MANPTAALLGEIQSWLRRFVSLRDDHQILTLALYVLHTYALQAAGVTPYVVILSPERQCGKTLLLEVLEELCRYGRISSSMSEAGMYQLINADLSKRPTILIDEIDALFGRPTEQTEAVRGVINSGNRRSGRVTRGSKEGTAQDFSTFACKVLAGIDAGGLPSTVQDRSIAIILQRKTDDVRLERHAAHKLEVDYRRLRKRFDAWARENGEALGAAEPSLPDELSDRQKDGWEPLLSIADLAGDECSVAARAAAVALRDDFGDGSESRGVRLLGDIRDALDGQAFIATAELVAHLNAHEEHPWSRMNRAKGITAYDVARLLRPYRIQPTKKRIGATTARGYLADDLRDAWARYLPLGSVVPPEQPTPSRSGHGRSPTHVARVRNRNTSATGDEEVAESDWTPEAADAFIARAQEMFPGSVELACSCPPGTLIRDDRCTGCGARAPSPFGDDM